MFSLLVLALWYGFILRQELTEDRGSAVLPCAGTTCFTCARAQLCASPFTSAKCYMVEIQSLEKGSSPQDLKVLAKLSAVNASKC